MVGSIRRVRVTLAFLSLIAASGAFLAEALAGDDQPRAREASEPPKDQKREAASSKPGQVAESRAEVLATFAQLGDDTVKPFVPLRPATVEDRRRTEVLRLFGAGRAGGSATLVGRGGAAPGSAQDRSGFGRHRAALSRIYVGALGRPDLAVQYSKRVLAAEPDDSDTLTRLVDFYNQRRSDPASALASSRTCWPIPSSTPTGPGV